jgi:hypothetical protein
MKRKHGGQISKLTALMLIQIVALAMLGIAYSHWQETLTITGTIKTGYVNLVIGSEKVLVPRGEGYDENHPITYYKTPDNHILIVTCENVTSGWRIAIGLLMHNEGTLPLIVKDVSLTFENAEGIMEYFTITTYYYGSYPTGTNFNQLGAWDGIKIEDAPVNGYVTPPMPLDPCEHAISWTLIQFDTVDHNAEGKTIIVTATLVDDPFYKIKTP